MRQILTDWALHLTIFMVWTTRSDLWAQSGWSHKLPETWVNKETKHCVIMTLILFLFNIWHLNFILCFYLIFSLLESKTIITLLFWVLMHSGGYSGLFLVVIMYVLYWTQINLIKDKHFTHCTLSSLLEIILSLCQISIT